MAATPSWKQTGGLIAADYRAHYAYKHEGERRARLLALPRILTNASMHATVLVRVMQASPDWMAWFWRRMLISKHAMDVTHGLVIAPGLQLPHPIGIVLGHGCVLGHNVVLHHNVTVSIGQGRWFPGERDEECIQIGDDVTLYPNCMVLGPIRVGHGARIGAFQLVLNDIPPGAVVKDGRVVERLSRGGTAATEPASEVPSAQQPPRPQEDFV